MANLQATIRGQTLLKPPPKDCLNWSNKLLYQSTDRQKFATLFYGVLDKENHQLCYSNAGHNRPFLFRENLEPQSLENAGIVLSFLENFDFDEWKIDLNPNDLLLIYSDWISEAMNHKHEEFGEERLALLVNEP